MKKNVFFLFLLLIFSINADIKILEEKNLIKIETDIFNIEINPRYGGRISSFIPKKTGKDIIFSKEDAGLFIGHFWEQIWPGEFWGKAYSYKIEKKDEEVSVILSTISTGRFGNTYSELLSDIEIEKKLTFYKNKNYIKCNISIKNNTDKGKIFGYWMQNIFTLNGSKEGDLYIRPSRRGIDITNPSEYENSWVYDVISGWTATIDKKIKDGFVFLMDYNYLRCLYNCQPSCTTEWRYDKVMIPPGKKWETEVYMIYVKGITNIAHANKYFLIGLDVYKKENAIELSYNFLPLIEKISSVDIEVKIESPLTKKEKELGKFKVTKLDKSIAQKLKDTSPLTDPQVVHNVLDIRLPDGDIIKDNFDYFYAGEYIYGKNIMMDMVTPVYLAPLKEKKQVFLKPEKIKKRKNEKIQILFLKGIFSNLYGIEEKYLLYILGGGKIKNSYYKPHPTATSLSYFPGDYNTLMFYDLIVFGDIDFSAIEKFGCEMIYDYVVNGGSVLFLGGCRSYSQSKFKGTKIEDILPVYLEETTPDYEKLGPLPLKIRKELLKKVDIPENSMFVNYLHKLKVKPGAEVLIWAGDEYPFLVAWKYGKGKVGAILGTVWGEGTKENPLFFESEYWPLVIIKTIEYLWKN